MSKKTSRVARYINRRIVELRPRRSQLEIATAAGFQSPHMLSMIKDGKAKLPLSRVAMLAKALECDPSYLMHLSLDQFFDQPVIDLISSSVGSKQAQGKGGANSPNKDLDVVAAWLIALEMEAKLAVHDGTLAKQFATSSGIWAERVDARVTLLLKDLGDLVAAVKSPGGILRGEAAQPPKG